MSNFVHIPRMILEDENISNIQKNILIYLYIYMNPITNITKIKNVTLANDLNLQQQNISKYLKGLEKYVTIIKNPTDKKQNWYKLMENKKDFIQIDSQLYRQWKTNPNIIIEYLKYKNSYFLIRLLSENNKDFKLNRFEHAKYGGWDYLYFCKMEQELYNNGFIDWVDYYVSFNKENDIEQQIKQFINCFNNKKEGNKDV